MKSLNKFLDKCYRLYKRNPNKFLGHECLFEAKWLKMQKNKKSNYIIGN